MSDARGKPYRPWHPEPYRREAHSPETTLPQDALVWFLLETVPHVDLRRFYTPYEAATRGAPPFDPGMMGCLLLSASGVGVFSSRKIARAGERNRACIAIVGEDRPDFRTSSDFRTLHLAAFCEGVGPGRRIAGESGLVTRGKVSPDGTTLQGNASRHNAMSSGERKQEVERLRAELEALVTQASQQDAEDDAVLGSRRGDALPAALARRADRGVTIEAAMQRVDARAKAEAEAERQRRAEAEAARKRPGKKRCGRTPQAGEETPGDPAQMRFTAPELGIMPTTNKGGDDCGNAQARGDGAYQISVACDVTAAAKAKQHAVPMAPWTVAYLAPAGSASPTDAAGGIEKMPGTYDSG